MAIEWGDTQRDRVAKALYDHQVKSAREHIEKMPFDPEEVEELVRKLRSESQTAQVLIFFSYLDDRIQQLISLQLRPNPSKAELDRLFGAMGPLSTFSNRILIAYHLGWLSTSNREKLDAFRRIRNEFAHRAFKVQIDDPLLAPYLATLDFDIPAMIEKAGEPESAKYSALLCQLVMLALNTFKELLVLPTAKIMQVSPADVAGTFDETPALLKRISLTMSGALILSAGLVIKERNHE